MKVEECVKDLVERLGRKAAALILVEFTKVASGTVEDWILGKKTNGENLMRLRYLFEALGYKVEHREISPSVDKAARLIAFQVVSFEDIRVHLGYGARDTLYGVLLGRDGTTAERERKMDELFDEYSPLLEVEVAKLNSLRDELNLPVFPTALVIVPEVPAKEQKGLKIEAVNPDRIVQKKKEPLPQAIVATPEILPVSVVVEQEPLFIRSVVKANGQKDRTLLVEVLAQLINTVRPLAEQVVSSDFTPDERMRLRELTHMDGIFRLSNVLDKLCSETVRSQNKK